MNYAVIKTGGKQYKVSEGDIIDVDRLKAEKDTKVIFDQVLLLTLDDKVKIGKPFIEGVKVEGKLLDNLKGDKIRVSKFKAKVRYRKSVGFRASISRVLIEKIVLGKTSEAAKPKEKVVVKKTVKKKS